MSAGAVVRGIVSYACRATTPMPGALMVQVHVVIEQSAPRAPLVHLYLPMGAGSKGMDRAEAELRRLKRGTRVEAVGAALTVVDGQTTQLWLRGCMAVEAIPPLGAPAPLPLFAAAHAHAPAPAPLHP